MASTFKVPIAVRLLTQVDRGQLRLDSMIALRPTDLHPGSGTLSDLFRQPGVALSIRNLMELMLRISDNSATDIMLRTAGGSGPVNARLAELGVQGIRLDRSTVRLISDFSGIRNLPSDDVTLEEFGNLRRMVTDDERRAALATFDTDPRDTSTPEGMARLLEKVWRRQALSPANSDLLLDIMYRCETGANRIKGILPPETKVAHKTGTYPGTTNDVGIIDLPDGTHVAIAAYVKKSAKVGGADLEKAIAQASRAVYDYFLYSRDSGS